MGTMSEVKISNTGRRLDSKFYDVSVSIDANMATKQYRMLHPKGFLQPRLLLELIKHSV
jgi:hypothetical protein